ncbi:MAG: cytochrome d ubiquinol oxidase subunit II [Pseudomonadota bacterium]|nr:cytochrome d ubiquinol oxidase subunit II [Pseudomonadota bacterium]
MDQISFWLPVVWAGLIGVAVAMYVILDGFDLGLGILFPTAREESERDQMMNSVAPFWDGNETWLVLGGGGLWVAFPKAYAIIMPAVYLPIILMLLALIFRGVAFEFRFVSKPNHKAWDFAFWIGSTLAAFSQGLVLGALIQGIEVSGGQFGGGPLDWLTPFSIMCGVGVVAGYALLGAGWLMFKTEGPLAERSRRQAPVLLAVLLAFIAVVSLWTPIESARIADRWFSMPNIFYLWPVPLITALLAWWCYNSIRQGHEFTPFLATIFLFLLAYAGLAISNYPFLVPPVPGGSGLDVWQTAAAPESQIFVLIGVLLLLPIILFYTGFVYWTFRGKVKPGEGYH